MIATTYTISEILENPVFSTFLAHPSIPFFQNTAVLHFYKKLPKQETRVILCSHQHEILGSCVFSYGLGTWPLKYLSTKAQIIYGPIFYKETAEHDCLASILSELQKQIPWHNLFIQFRNQRDTSHLFGVYEGRGYKFSNRLNLITDVSKPETIWQNMSQNRRRQIKKSLANGLVLEYLPTNEQLAEFYSLLKHLYNHKVLKPLPELAFFSAINQLAHEGLIKGGIFVCIYQNRVVGGIVAPMIAGNSIYEWYICGLDYQLKSEGIYPSVLATWAAMEYGNRNGCLHFDFMGMGKPDEPYGVRDFKARFGGTWLNHGRWNKITNKPLYALAETLYNILYLIKKTESIFNPNKKFKT